MASTSSEAAPLLLARQDGEEDAAAAAVAAAPAGSSHQHEQEAMRSWAETMLCCCGAECGRLWRRVVLRKWLNVGAGSGDSDFSADDEGEDDEPDRQDKCCCERSLYGEERRLRGLGAGTIGDQMKAVPYTVRICKPAILLPQYIDVTELRIFVGTWNVGGRVPPTDLDIQEWLAMEEPADIYVLGFQEIVPLNAGNIFGAEDNHPVALWEHIIRETLNKKCPYKSKHKCQNDPPSPSKFNPSDYPVTEDALLSEPENESEGEFHPLIERPLDMRVHLQDGASFTSVTQENSNGCPEDNFDYDVSNDHRVVKRKRPYFVRIVSKQMVAIYLSVWVRRDLRRHIRNLRVSTVGVGAMGYIGNKASTKLDLILFHHSV